MPENNTNNMITEKRSISKTRRQYILKFIGRIAVFFRCMYLCIKSPQSYRILNGNEFSHSFSILHILWELCVMLYPERFWEKTNVSLKCSECTDKLCTQYCQKLRLVYGKTICMR